MILRTDGGARYHTRSFWAGEVFGYADDGGQPIASNEASNQAIEQGGVFNTEDQERTIERTEKQGFWRFAQELD